MRKGGGKEKGSRFERDVCTKLSLWLTQGARADLFSRNVLSGGRFTLQEAKGHTERGTPGDIMAAHPLAFDFLTHFMVECKHRASIDMLQFLADSMLDKSFLAKTYKLAERQAKVLSASPIVVARQNNLDTIIMMPLMHMKLAVMHSHPKFPFLYHATHIQAPVPIGMAFFEAFITMVDPVQFLIAVKSP